MFSSKKLTLSLVQRCNQSASCRNFQARSVEYLLKKQQQRVRTQHRHTTRRYLSSEKDGEQPLIEECAKSLSRLSSTQPLAPEAAIEIARKVSPEARSEIIRVASNAGGSGAAVAEMDVPPPTMRDLRYIALAQAIPFLGFGFMDNAILIIAGDAIDTSLGVVLGISTMCAAAIGNIISDVAGIMLGTVIEDFCANYLKLPMPNLTTAQRQLRSVRFANQLGCAVGIVIGCIIGMFPLLFIDSKKIQNMKRDAAMDSIFQDVVTEAKKLIGAQSTSLFIVVDSDPETNKTPLPNPDGEYLYAKYFHSDSNKISQNIFKMGRGIVSRAALTGQAWNIHDVHSEPDFSKELAAERDSVRNMVCVPVLDSNGKAIAVIRALNKTEEGSIGRGKGGKNSGDSPASSKDIQRKGFTNNDVQVLKALASHISVSLQYMYQDDREEAAAMGVKDTIKILKEHGLAGISEDKQPVSLRRQHLFPEA